MFTIDQIKAAHSKVKSGADFPAFINGLKNLGVASYETFVNDGHTDYYGADSYTTSSDAKYPALHISEQADGEAFRTALKLHQQGGTSYPQFCEDCARTGVEKWTVSIGGMTCTYFDCSGAIVLVENIRKVGT